MFAVTTDAPLLSASSTKVRATPVPPMSSTTMSAFFTTDIVSLVSSDLSIQGKSTSFGSRRGDAGDFDGTANALPELVLLLNKDARRLRANGAGSK